jgi:ketosteroid isomerase-like protein
MDQSFPNHFAQEWINAWNSHDITAIMSHYADDIDFCSPLVAKLGFDPSGRINNKTTLQAYFTTGLSRFPDLHFDLHQVLSGVSSVVLYYTSIGGKKSAEFMQFNESGKVDKVLAHYSEPA